MRPSLRQTGPSNLFALVALIGLALLVGLLALLLGCRIDHHHIIHLDGLNGAPTSQPAEAVELEPNPELSEWFNGVLDGEAIEE